MNFEPGYWTSASQKYVVTGVSENASYSGSR